MATVESMNYMGDQTQCKELCNLSSKHKASGTKETSYTVM